MCRCVVVDTSERRTWSGHPITYGIEHKNALRHANAPTHNNTDYTCETHTRARDRNVDGPPHETTRRKQEESKRVRMMSGLQTRRRARC